METQAIENAVKDMTKSTTDALGKFGEKIDGHGARLLEIEQMMTRRRSGGGDLPASWGKAMIDSDQFKNLVKQGRGIARMEVKSTITSLAASGGALVSVDQRLDPVLLARRRLGIRDLLSAGETTSNAIRYVQQSGRTLIPTSVSEGTSKPESTLTFDPATADVVTIAHWIPASKQILDDAPALMATIDSELQYGLDLEVETQILLGDGSAETLLGLIPSATAYAAPFQPEMMQRIDAILLAQAQLQALDFEATGVVLNPQDWARIRSTKDAEGRYVAGGPLTGAPKQLWDLPVVTSNSIAPTKFLIGDFKRAAIVFSRQVNTLEISTEHSDFFTRNLVAVRVECRIGMAVQQPEALVTGTFQATT
jgi:HK97 family phage major capsid protein